MKTVGITGHLGLIGTHLRAALHARKDLRVIGADKDEFANPEVLAGFVASCDALVHLAGLNRGPDEAVYETNVRLARQVVDACDRTGVRPHLVFSSSNHVRRGTRYGASKAACTELFAAWSARTGAPFCNLILPNVFGEGGRPFTNSVVSTFCHQVAAGETPRIDVDATMSLLHAQALAKRIARVLDAGETGEIEPEGTPLSVSALLDRIRALDATYRSHLLPDLRDPFDLALFNTYRSYLFPAHYPVPLDRRTDARGWLFEAVRTLNGGQAFVSGTQPGVTRGNHYHLTKFERFAVLSGRAEIHLRPLFSNSVVAFAVSGDTPSYVDIPTLHAHSLVNVGTTELITLFWANEPFDPARPDTTPEIVQEAP